MNRSDRQRQGSRITDTDVIDVLVNLDIIPEKEAGGVAIKTAELWATAV